MPSELIDLNYLVMQKTILIIDDEQPIREMIGMRLEIAGYKYIEAENGTQAFQQIAAHYPDLILLDWMLPDMSGLEITKRLKKDPKTKEIPIIMVTARAEEDNKIRGLGTGVDDYVVKPFSPRELIARIEAVLRRANTHEDGILTVQQLQIDSKSERVTVNGASIKLTPNEYRLLYFLMTHMNRVYSREQLLDRVWGHDNYIDERTVDVQIRRLRKVLADHDHDHLIQTVRGSGYRFSEEP